MNLLKVVKDFGDAHGSTLCFAGAIVGVGLVIVETWVTRPKVDKILEEQKAKRKAIEEKEFPTEDEKKTALTANTVETVRKVGMASLPLGAATVGTIGLMAGSKIIDAKTINNLTATVQLGEMAYKNLSDAIPAVIGEEKAEEIKQESAQRSANDWAETGRGEVLQGRGGDTLFYDSFLGRPFRSDIHSICEACDEAATVIRKGKEPYITYNELVHDYLYLPGAVAAEGYRWSGNDSDDFPEPKLTNTVLVNEEAAIVLEWRQNPTTKHKI